MSDKRAAAGLRLARGPSVPGLLLAAIGLPAAAAILLVAPAPAAAQCVLDWSDEFNLPGADGAVEMLFVWDAGGGPELLVGGRFYNAGKVYSPYLARYDGQAFAPFTLKPPPYPSLSNVRCAAVFDDGTGPALYLGGGFAPVKWDGRTFTRLGFGVGDWPSETAAMAVYDDGSGPALYYGGNFLQIGNPPVEAYGIARWDGHAWHDLAGGFNMMGWYEPEVHALAVYDPPGPQGPGLYVGGWFARARSGGPILNNVARWDAGGWSPLLTGAYELQSLDGGKIYALAVHDDGHGPALYAGGRISHAGGVPAERVARWDGQAWEGLGGGISGFGITMVYALATGPDDRLYAGGSFETAGGQPANSIAAWDGDDWHSLEPGLRPDTGIAAEVYALKTFDDGIGPQLYAGGRFVMAGDEGAANVARWDGQRWAALTPGQGLNDVTSMGGAVHSLAWYDDGVQPSVYVGGQFTIAGSVPTQHLARWDGQRWWAADEGFANPWVPLEFGPQQVNKLFVHEAPAGPTLYAGVTAYQGGPHLYRRDEAMWTPLARAITTGAPSSVARISALAVFDDGAGENLYVGGLFWSIEGVPANSLARWNGAAWRPVGDGVLGATGYAGAVSALHVHDDGGGPALFIGGRFQNAGSLRSPYVVKWDGTQYHALADELRGSGTPPDMTVRSLASWRGPNGPELYAGAEDLTMAGGQPARGIAIWNGQHWRPFPVWFQDVASYVSELKTAGEGPDRIMLIGGGMRVDNNHFAGAAVWDGARFIPWRADNFPWIRGGGSGGIVVFGSGTELSGYTGGRYSGSFSHFLCLPGMIPGDTNCDGVIDGEDIDPFVLALTKPNLYAQQLPGCDVRTADCNYDGLVDNEDIDAFIELLMP